jgi:hypothetical protein
MIRMTLCAAALLAFVAPGIAAFGAEPIATSLETSAAQDYVGTWDLTMEFQGTPVEMQLNIVDVDGKIGATIDNERMPEPTAITEAAVDDSGITLTYDMDFGGNAFTIDIKGKLDGETLSGTLAEQSGLFTADFTGAKGTAPAAEPEAPAIAPTELDTSEASEYLGFWNLVMDFQGNPVDMQLNVVDVGGKVGATIDGERMPEPAVVPAASVGEDGLTLTYDMDFGGNAFTINVTGKLVDGKMEGTFAEKSGLFTANFTGEKGEAPVVARAEGGRGEGEEGGRRRRGGGPSAKLTIDGKDITITFAELKVESEEGVESEDYETLVNLEDGALFKFVGGRATKLRTDHSLKFGDTVVKKENAAPNYPGVYSLWLKKVSGDTWHLVFNEDADIWGTQHVPARDAAEVPLTMSKASEPSGSFRVALEEQGEGGALKVMFGDMVWTADFTVTE